MTEIKQFDSIFQISQEQWQRVEADSFPFTDYCFFEALESTGCVGERTGWFPRFWTLWKDGKLHCAMYLFQKTNSYGEYIFDWAWADAYAQHGLAYFPKIVSMVPFTPATGPKILRSKDCSRDSEVTLLKKVLATYQASNCSSFHGLFLHKSELELWLNDGFVERYSMQYHWTNRGYTSFEDFVGNLKGKRRRQIVSERKKSFELPLSIETFSGETLREEHGTIMFQFYLQTISQKQAIPYLTQEFFEVLFRKYHQNIVFIAALQGQKIVAGSLFFTKGKNLYGRYWGTDGDFRHLHFELCYYQGIDYCIEKGLQLFEAGAQGGHKLARGFEPALIRSAHHIQHPRFRDAIERFILEEKRELLRVIDCEKQHSPFKSFEVTS